MQMTSLKFLSKVEHGGFMSTIITTWKPAMEGLSEVQGQPWLHSDFKEVLCYKVSPALKHKTKQNEMKRNEKKEKKNKEKTTKTEKVF